MEPISSWSPSTVVAAISVGLAGLTIVVHRLLYSIFVQDDLSGLKNSAGSCMLGLLEVTSADTVNAVLNSGAEEKATPPSRYREIPPDSG